MANEFTEQPRALLFIGGSKDGKWHPVTERHVWLPVIPRETGPFDPSFDAEHYRRETIRTQSTTFEVMVISGMTLDAVLSRLLQNYRPN